MPDEVSPIFAANWKMHKTRAEARAFVETFNGLPRTGDEGDVVICESPTYVGAIGAFKKLLELASLALR